MPRKQRRFAFVAAAGIAAAGIVAAGPALAQGAGAPASGTAGITATTRPPVPSVPPPISTPGMTAGQTPTNPPEVIGRPATASPGSVPLTGHGGALGGSDQVSPSVGATTPHG